MMMLLLFLAFEIFFPRNAIAAGWYITASTFTGSYHLCNTQKYRCLAARPMTTTCPKDGWQTATADQRNTSERQQNSKLNELKENKTWSMRACVFICWSLLVCCFVGQREWTMIKYPLSIYLWRYCWTVVWQFKTMQATTATMCSREVSSPSHAWARMCEYHQAFQRCFSE